MALPVFDFPHYIEWEDNIEFDVLTTTMESGKKQKRVKRDAPRRSFGLKFKKEEVDMIDIYNFFKDRMGSAYSFYWNHPRTGEQIEVRFAVDKLNMQALGQLMYEFGLPIEEVL